MSTIIDQSEKIKLLALAPLESLVIERDSGTPKHERTVHVTAQGISLGLGSSILIENNAKLTLNGAVSANILGTIDIGNAGKLFLNSSLGIGLLSTIKFTNTDGPASLLINTSKVDLSGNISGFGVHDQIVLGNLGAVSAAWSQTAADSGTLALYNAAGTEVDSIGLNGEYSTGNFKIKEMQGKHGTDVTRVVFVAQEASSTPAQNGFVVPSADRESSSAAPVYASLKTLQSAETEAATRFFGGLTHHG